MHDGGPAAGDRDESPADVGGDGGRRIARGERAERGTRPVIIAHRGASGYLPEHSLPAKAMAHAFGADFLEQDLCMTKDGEVVVIHDPWLDELTDVADRFPGRARADGRTYVLDLTLAELRTLRLSERFEVVDGVRRPVDRKSTRLNSSH